MKDSTSMKNLIIGSVVVIIVGFAAYFYINRTPFVEEELLTGVVSGASPATLDGNFISALNSLRKLKFDDSIFKNQAWGTLTDFGRTLAPQPTGRPNPFAPINPSSEAPVETSQ